MKPGTLLPLIVAAGLCLGGGSGALVRFLEAKPAFSGPELTGDLVFVPTGPILTPLVGPEGRLAGYAEIQVQLQVPAGAQELAASRMPILLHAINLRSYRTPLASAPDGDIPNLAVFRKLIEAAIPEAFESGFVRRIAITEARPA